VQTLNPRVPWFTGATELPVPTPSLSGISLVVDPERVLDTLRLVAPRINRVSIVIPPARFGWLKPAIERAGRARNIQTTLFEASSIAEAASHYYNIIRYGNPRADSLWLLEQGQFITPDTLPRLIEWSWAQEFLLFSSVLEHVNEGSLFALYVNPGSSVNDSASSRPIPAAARLRLPLMRHRREPSTYAPRVTSRTLSMRVSPSPSISFLGALMARSPRVSARRC